MPELPEVETVVRSLRPLLVGARFESVTTSDKKLRQPIDRAALGRYTAAATVESIERRAKYIIIRLSSGYSLLCHLGMSGRLLFAEPDSLVAPHTHVRFVVRTPKLDETVELRFVDPRRFGLLLVRDSQTLWQSKELHSLGIDPLSSEFTDAALDEAMRQTKRILKLALLDQTLICGLGNIYICEALFMAKLRPTKKSHTLKRDQVTALHEAIVAVLTRAVTVGGTSISDYINAHGETGWFQLELKVYGREGEPCIDCKTPIKRVVHGGRSTFYCRRCQVG